MAKRVISGNWRSNKETSHCICRFGRENGFLASKPLEMAVSYDSLPESMFDRLGVRCGRVAAKSTDFEGNLVLLAFWFIYNMRPAN